MERSSASNRRIFIAIPYIIFFILFIFLQHPLTVHAEGTNIGQVSNISSYGTNEDDQSSNEQAGYLEWAASGDRCGVLYYVIDDLGRIQAQGVLLDEAGTYKWGDYAGRALGTGEFSKYYLGVNRLSVRAGNNVYGLGMPIKYVNGISPVYYSGGWQAKGSDAMNYLMQIALDERGVEVKIEIGGTPQPLPNWAAYVMATGQNGITALKQLAKPDTKWQVILEPVSVNYLYTDKVFTEDTIDAKKDKWTAGSPMPSSNYDAYISGTVDSWKPMVYIGTAYNLITSSNTVTGITGGGQYTYKFYNTQLPYSLCLDHDIEVPIYTGSYNTPAITFEGVHSTVHKIGGIQEIGSEGIGMAAIDITGFLLPPLHTFDGTHTPGNTEPPSETNGTDGDCIIQKLYYTQKISTNGTILEETTDYHPYEQTNTTAYISIDTESGYEMEGWKVSTTYTSLTTKSVKPERVYFFA